MDGREAKSVHRQALLPGKRQTGGAGGSRTHNPFLRTEQLYPIELRPPDRAINSASPIRVNLPFAPKMRVDNRSRSPKLHRSFQVMSTNEEKQQSLTPEQFPFTAPQMMNRYVTDTGKILPRKYTGLSARQQRAVTRTIKQSRNTLLAL